MFLQFLEMIDLWHPAPRAPFFNHLFPQVYINSNINVPPQVRFWRNLDPTYRMKLEYIATNNYPPVSDFVNIFLMARQNHTPVHIYYTYKIENRRQFNDQFEKVLEEVRRINEASPQELRLYYLEGQNAIIGNVAWDTATRAVELAKELFPLQSPSRDEFIVKVYYHTYDKVIDERWRISRDFIDVMIREEMIEAWNLIF